jgi:hypothetical protein
MAMLVQLQSRDLTPLTIKLGVITLLPKKEAAQIQQYCTIYLIYVS